MFFDQWISNKTYLLKVKAGNKSPCHPFASIFMTIRLLLTFLWWCFFEKYALRYFLFPYVYKFLISNLNTVRVYILLLPFLWHIIHITHFYNPLYINVFYFRTLCKYQLIFHGLYSKHAFIGKCALLFLSFYSICNVNYC